MKTLLIIPMYNTVLLPDVDYRLSVDSISDVEKDRIETDQGKAVFLPLKTEKKRGEMTAEDFYPFGIAVDVTQISEGGDRGQGQREGPGRKHQDPDRCGGRRL